jgi:hypothetical protein
MILYSNSCSFGAPNQGHAIYPEVIASALGADLINDGLPGSCCRRIIRTSLRSLIKLKNQDVKITALIGLSFLGRTELWRPSHPSTNNDGDFHPLFNNKIVTLDWSRGLTVPTYPDIYKYADTNIKEYYKQWLIHLNPEADVTNLLADIIMLINFARANDIKIFVFCNTEKFPRLPEVDISAPFLKDFVNYAITDKSIIDLWNFSFADYALSRGHEPKDKDTFGHTGHPNEQAHIDFGNYLLEQHINVI